MRAEEWEGPGEHLPLLAHSACPAASPEGGGRWTREGPPLRLLEAAADLAP